MLAHHRGEPCRGGRDETGRGWVHHGQGWVRVGEGGAKTRDAKGEQGEPGSGRVGAGGKYPTSRESSQPRRDARMTMAGKIITPAKCRFGRPEGARRATGARGVSGLADVPTRARMGLGEERVGLRKSSRAAARAPIDRSAPARDQHVQRRRSRIATKNTPRGILVDPPARRGSRRDTGRTA